MASFRIRVLALAVLLVLLTQVGTVGAILFSSSREIAARGDVVLAKARDLARHLSAGRTARLRSAGTVLAGDPSLRETLEAGDVAGLERLLGAYVRQAELDVGILLDADGRALASTVLIEAGRLRMPGLITHSQMRGPERFPLRVHDSLYEVVTVPVPGMDPAAWLALGFRVDARIAGQLAATTGLDVTLLARQGPKPVMLGSSLPQASAARLIEAVLDNMPGPGMPGRVGSADAEHVALLAPFIPGAADVDLVLSEPLDDVMAPYRSLRHSIIGFSTVVLLLALLGGVMLSRTVTRPVQELVHIARRIGDGDYRQPVEVRDAGEIGELGRALNTMQLGIAEREARISRQARYDTLTGLPTRLHAIGELEDAIRRAAARRRPVAVLAVDLNGLGTVAASLGSDVGDALLCQAAERLRGLLDARHTLARLEGDLFLAILPDTDQEAAAEIAGDLRRFLAAGLSVGDVNVGVDARCGLAIYPRHGDEPRQLLKRALVARNDARRVEEGVQLYEEGNEERQHRQLTLLADLRRAARHDEFRVYMQPKIRLRDGRICGAEALLRWEHPTFGFLTPDQFIPVAEQSGNIGIVTRWALTAAVRECRLWLEEGLHAPVSVNLSAHDLKDEDLPGFVRSLLRDHDLRPDCLCLEITEQAVMKDFARATLILQKLRALGVRIAIDDFGTGQSSLAKLRHLPLDEIKVDRAFLENVPEDRQNAAIVRSVVELGHDLGLQVVAEGVETQAAYGWLQAIGCEQAQGYLISRPIPADRLVYWAGENSLAQTPPALLLQAAS